MRNLVLFLTRNYYILLFIFLQSFSIFLVVQNNHFHRAHFLNSANALTGTIYETYSGITDYFGLKETNRKLAIENALLRNQLRKSLTGNASARITENDSLHKQQYVYVTAKVVSNSVNRKKNYLTLNAGSKQGIQPDMAVISGEGVVGVVRDVSENFSSVMSVLHADTRIPSVIKKYGENSFLSWDGTDEWHAKLDRIPAHLKLLKGDTIITNSLSSRFPEGVMVGTVDNFEKIRGNTFYDVTVKLSTNFNRLVYVNVVINLMKEEQNQLENTIPHD